MAIAKGGPQEAARVMTDTFAVAAVRCDREGRFLWVNPTYARWAARAPEKIVGARIVDIGGARAREKCVGSHSDNIVGRRAMAEFHRFVDPIIRGEPVTYERLVELPGLG